MAAFENPKNSISTTFPLISPNRPPHTNPHHFSLSGGHPSHTTFPIKSRIKPPSFSLSEVSFAHEFPTKYPPFLPIVSPCRGGNTGRFSGRILRFSLKFNGFSVSFRLFRHEIGGSFRGRNWAFLREKSLVRGDFGGLEREKMRTFCVKNHSLGAVLGVERGENRGILR